MAAVDIEDLHSMIVGIRHQDSVSVGDGDVVGVVQLADPTPVAAKLADECTVGLEHLDGR